MSFGERLKFLMTQRGVMQKDLADYLNVMPTAVSNYVVGLREPEQKILVEIADYFGVTVDYLLDHKVPSSADENSLLIRYRNMSESQREMLVDFMGILEKYTVLPTDKR